MAQSHKQFFLFVRYYKIIVLSPSADFNLAIWKKRCLVIVWLLQIIYITASQLPWYLTARANGYPEEPLAKVIHDIPQNFYLMVLMNTLVLNIPDFISVCVYLMLVWRLRRVAIQPEVHELSDNPGDYAGIWVGGEPDIHGNHHHQDSSSIGAPPPPQHSGQEGSSEDIKTVLNILKWHVLSSLVDLTLILSNLSFCSDIGKASSALFQIFCYYYIPYFVILNNFRQFNGLSNCMKPNST